MFLMLLRHGEAGPATRDDLRTLTPRGVRQTEQCCQWAKTLALQPTLMIMSPYLRAQQTAEIAGQFFCPPMTETSDKLIPEASLPVLIEYVDEKSSQLESQDSSILLVGHQPLLGNLLAFLTGDQQLAYGLTTSSLTVLELDALLPGYATMVRQYVP